jgi:protease-4
MDEVEELAQGHVYSGKLAKELKLVDELGNIDRALASAVSMSKLKEYQLVEYPKSVDKLDELISSISGQKREDATLKKLLGDDYIMYKEIQKIKSQQNQIQAVMPWFEIK